MRHRVKGKKLRRTASHRTATMRSLSVALLTHHRIVTTLTKAKALRSVVEPIINRGKVDSTHNRRLVFSYLRDKAVVTKLFDEIGPKVIDREGGYTRVLKLGTRAGDAAEMAVIELVDYNESETSDSNRKRKRTRRAGKATKSSETTAAVPTTANAETDATAKSPDSDVQSVEDTEADVNQVETVDSDNVEVSEAETSDSQSTTDAEPTDVEDTKKEEK